MEIPEFWINVIASLVASIIFTGIGAILLKYWKGLAIGIGALAFIAGAGTLVIWGINSAVDSYNESREVVYLQKKVDRFIKGNYKDQYDEGWRANVHKISPRLVMALSYPEQVKAHKTPHPFYNHDFQFEISEMLKDEGYSNRPFWVFEVRPISEEEYNKILEQTKG